MNRKTWVGVTSMVAMMFMAVVDVSAAEKKSGPATPLTESGQKLETQYAEQLKALQTEIAGALPKIDEPKKAAFVSARDAVKKAERALNAAKQQLSKVGVAKALVEHAKGKWIGGAEKGIAAATAAMKKATTDAEREAAQKDLTKWQKNKEDGLKALKEREEALAAAKPDEPKGIQEHAAAEKGLAEAQTRMIQAVNGLDLASFLATGKLDSRLAKFVVLFEATPQGLAEFAQQGAEQAALVDKLLADDALLKLLVLSDGAAGGKYGQAMEIYAAIQKASPKAKGGVLQRLALAIALEHAVPVKQSNAAEKSGDPATVDPLKRYLAYEKAFLDGELDPAFQVLSTWDLRFVVSGDEPDAIAAWGRQMLRNYRPDLIFDPNLAWRYVHAVRTDVQYGSQNVKFDRPSLQNYQNIIMNGGICGRRAFFGRFILRSFGIPTTARPQTGHAA